jgi:transcriptional regulator with XRE-family HTH domain
MITNEIGNIIRFHRKKSGLTQKALADIAGVGKTVVFDIENGKKQSDSKIY